jgi:hypothetical protein
MSMGELMTVAEFWQREGCTTEDERAEYLAEWMHEHDYTAPRPTLCSRGCYADVEGCCRHGHPSLLLVLGLADELALSLAS